VTTASVVRAPRCLLIVDVADVTRRHHAVIAALAAGVDAVQLRDKHAAGGPLLDAARTLRASTRAHGAALLVNDRVDVAVAAGAEGVHLPAAAMPIAAARRLLGPSAWIGRSTHAADEAHAATAAGADYVILGPIYATPSKSAYGAPLGVRALAAAAGASCPIIAIGGIGAAEARAARRAGASGVAVIRAILDAPDPAAAVGEILTALTADG